MNTIDEIKKLSKFLNSTNVISISLSRLMNYEEYSKIQCDDYTIKIDLDSRTANVETWLESYHNGNPYGENKFTLQLSDDHLIAIRDHLRELSLQKVKLIIEREEIQRKQEQLEYRLLSLLQEQE